MKGSFSPSYNMQLQTPVKVTTIVIAMDHDLQIGEFFILGFKESFLPVWLKDFARKYGLGGVILFDYDCASRKYERNIINPIQLKSLCQEVAAMPSRPLVFIDQEGGKVRRLKEDKGFQFYPSAKEFNLLPEEKKIFYTHDSFSEMKRLGIHYNLAPVIDIDSNPDNPDIGKIERSYSNSAVEIEKNVAIVNKLATKINLGLCIKHFPGIGGSNVNSHNELMDLSADINDTQLDLFYRLGEKINGAAILLSHGYVRQWDETYPVSISSICIAKLRQGCPDALLITDDLQMQGMQKLFTTAEAVKAGLCAGVDMLLVGNNLHSEENTAFAIAEQAEYLLANNGKLQKQVQASLKRISERKKSLYSR